MTTKEIQKKDTAVLMADGCTKAEAKALLDKGTTVWDSLEGYIQSMKDCDLYEDGLEDDIRTGRKSGEINLVIYEGHEYCIEYCS